MKKKNVIIIALCVVVVALIIVVAFLIGKNSSKDEATVAPTLAPTAATQAVTEAPDNSGDVKKDDIKVVKEYTYLEDDDYKMVLVLENTGKGNAAVAVVGKVSDGANNVIGTERESVFLDPGAQSVVDLDFDTEGVKVMNKDYSISVAKATTIVPGISKITSSNKVNGNIVTVTSKNTGDTDLEGVEACVLFFDGNDLVDIESEDVNNTGTEIFGKGTTQTQQFNTHEKFNKVKVYYTQTQDTHDDEDDD